MTIQQRAIATRDQLLDTAQEAFARYGYEATGVADICAAAGVSKGAFYHHFLTKQALFLALFNRWLATLDGSLQAIRANAGNPVEAIEGLSELLRPLFKDGRAQTPGVLVFEFWSVARHDPTVWQAVIEPYRRYRALLADILRNGIASGTFRPVDAALTAQIFMSQLAGLLLQGMLDPDGADWGAVMGDSMREFLARLTAVTGVDLDASVGLTLARTVPAAPLPSPIVLPAENQQKKKKKKSKHKH